MLSGLLEIEYAMQFTHDDTWPMQNIYQNKLEKKTQRTASGFCNTRNRER